MIADSKAPKVKFLTPRERLGVRLLLQSKVRLALISTLIATPFLASSAIAYRLYTQNQALASSAKEVVDELQILDKEIEELSRRAGLPRVRPNVESGPVSLAPTTGRGGVPIEIEVEAQLEIARQKLPTLSRKLETETKPALEETLEKEAVISQATPSGDPVKGTFEVSSDFGIRPNPYGGGYEGHDGIDILGEHGRPIFATASGKAERAHYDGGYGNFVLLKNDQGYETLYAHLSELAVKPGQNVKQGQLVGFMGNTGRSTGTHLHYSIYYQGKALDPKPFMGSNWTYYAEAFN